MLVPFLGLLALKEFFNDNIKIKLWQIPEQPVEDLEYQTWTAELVMLDDGYFLINERNNIKMPTKVEYIKEAPDNPPNKNVQENRSR